MTVAAAITQLATVAQAAAATLGVRANLIYAAPPEQVPAFPALVLHWSGSDFGQFPFETVPTGFQSERATVTALYLAGTPTMSRAHPAVLAFVGAFRAVVAANQNLGGAVRQARVTRASIGPVEWNGNEHHGAELGVEMDLLHATTWVEA